MGSYVKIIHDPDHAYPYNAQVWTEINGSSCYCVQGRFFKAKESAADWAKQKGNIIK